VVRVEYDQGISEIRLYVDGVLQTQTSNSIADMASTFPTSTFSCGYTSVVGWPAYVGAVYSNVRVFYESPPAENRVQQSNGADAYTWFALGDNTVRLQVPGGTLVTPASQTPIPVEQWARVFVESDHVTDTLKVHVDDNASTPEASSAATPFTDVRLGIGTTTGAGGSFALTPGTRIASHFLVDRVLTDAERATLIATQRANIATFDVGTDGDGVAYANVEAVNATMHTAHEANIAGSFTVSTLVHVPSGASNIDLLTGLWSDFALAYDSVADTISTMVNGSAAIAANTAPPTDEFVEVTVVMDDVADEIRLYQDAVPVGTLAHPTGGFTG